MGFLRVLARHKVANILFVFLAVQLACIVLGLLFPDSFRYLSMVNVQVLLKSVAPLAILSIGVGLLMISGEFDLSVGSNCALSAYVMAMAYRNGEGLQFLVVCAQRVPLLAPIANEVPLLAAIALALLTGAAIGLINGLITTRAKIPSFIVTLGAMMVWRGVLLFLSGSSTEPFYTGETAKMMLTGSYGVIQAQFVWAVIIAVGAHFLLEHHRLGNHMFSAGGNRDAARAIGVNVDRVKVKAFIIVGVLTAFAGVLSTARVNQASPELGRGYELQAIAACVVGGLSLMGGVGTILGIFLGAALLCTIQDVLSLVRVRGEYLELYVGLLIIVAVIFNRITSRNKDT